MADLIQDLNIGLKAVLKIVYFCLDMNHVPVNDLELSFITIELGHFTSTFTTIWCMFLVTASNYPFLTRTR